MEARTTKKTAKTGELRKTKATEESKGGTHMQIFKGERE